MSRRKIDSHTHIFPSSLPDFKSKFGYGGFIQLLRNSDGSADMIRDDGKFFRRIEPNCWEPELRIAEYAEKGVDEQIVCTIPVMFSYWAQPKDGAYVSRFLNDQLAAQIQPHPQHYHGLGTVPMQSVELAIEEMRYCKEKLGFRGLQIGSNVNQKNLSEPEFFPFWEACEAENMALLIHPWEMMGEAEMQKYWLPWLVGMPAETSRAVCSMIFGGVFERFPKLRVLFAHAGGSFLPTIGRVEHGYNCRPDLVAIDNQRPPSDYLGHFWVDSATHDGKLLDYVLDLQGSSRVAFGTDYPFPLGDLELGAFIEERPYSEEVKNNIFSQAAIEWLFGTV